MRSQIKSLLQQVDKEKAIMVQKLEFQQRTADDLRNQLAEQKLMHEETLKTFQSSVSGGQVDLNLQIENLTQNHKQEIATYEKSL